MQTQARRESDRLKKRRKRERFYRLGLSCFGTPRKNRVGGQQAGAVGTHPAGCLCRDCLWGETLVVASSWPKE